MVPYMSIVAMPKQNEKQAAMTSPAIWLSAKFHAMGLRDGMKTMPTPRAVTSAPRPMVHALPSDEPQQSMYTKSAASSMLAMTIGFLQSWSRYSHHSLTARVRGIPTPPRYHRAMTRFLGSDISVAISTMDHRAR